MQLTSKASQFHLEAISGAEKLVTEQTRSYMISVASRVESQLDLMKKIRESRDNRFNQT